MDLVKSFLTASIQPRTSLSKFGGGSTQFSISLLKVGIACTLGGVIMPISGPSALILLSVLAEYGVKIDFLQWVLVGAPTMTVVCVAVYVFSNSELQRIFLISNFF